VIDLDAALSEIEAIVRESPREVVAVGEIGLDDYWKDVPLEVQRVRFVQQLGLARRLGLPVVIHCRDALDEIIALLEREGSLPPGVFHCFSGTPRHAERVLELGFHVSFAGNVTYPKASDLRHTAQRVPLSRLLLETDSPFLAPQARRGKRNEPAFLPYTLACLAEIHGVLPEELAKATLDSTLRLFSLEERLGEGGALGAPHTGIR
jgi:TatD DNase family protein